MKIFIILLLSNLLITNTLHAQNLQYDSKVGQLLLRGFFKIMRPRFCRIIQRTTVNSVQQLSAIISKTFSLFE